MSSALTLHIVGSSPAMPRPGGACSSYLVQAADAAVLLDIGSGTLAKLLLALHHSRLDAIVISHMHADHFFDLVPLRHSMKYEYGSAVTKIPLWLPPGGSAALEALRNAASTDTPENFFDGVFEIAEYDPEQPLDVKSLRLSFQRTRHYIEGYAVRVDCSGRSITYSSDSAPCDALVERARGSQLFLCEAALGLGSEHGQRGHSSAQEAGEMAARAGVERLVLTHYPAFDPPDALIEAAKRTFPGPVAVAEDGLELSV